MNSLQTRTVESWPEAARRAAQTIPMESRMEHRWGQRRPCQARVCVSAGGGIAGSARLRNVSLSGAFLETTVILPLFSQVAVALLDLSGSRYTSQFKATVVRRERDGVGIEWTETAGMPVCRMLGCTEACVNSMVPSLAQERGAAHS